MNLDTPHITKADTALQEALREAESTQPLRAVLILSDAEAPEGATQEKPPSPGSFGSRSDYRRASIQHQQARLSRNQGPTIEALRALQLEVHGGHLGRAVVVDGPAASVAESLSLPGVRQANLDQRIELIEPRRPAVASRLAAVTRGARRKGRIG